LIKPVSAELASAYVENYVALSKVTREKVMNWLPFVAAARLAENVPDEVKGLMEMAGARL
jgi:hypothetical protein